MPPKRTRAARETQRESSDEDIERPHVRGREQLDKAAAKLVRMALFYEYRRQVLRRDAIVKAVIPKTPRMFADVLEIARGILKQEFGMDLVELRARHKGDVDDPATQTQAETKTQRDKGKQRAQNGDAEEDGDGEAQEAEEVGTQRLSKKTNVFVLRSILDPRLVAAMARPLPLPLSAEDALSERDREALQADSGALLPWDRADGGPSGGAAMLGIRTVILSLILCLGKSAPEPALLTHLRRLGLERNTILPYRTPDSLAPVMTLEKYLDLLAKQNYLDKIVTRNGENLEVEWRWGPREVEFSEVAAGKFIEEVFMNDENEESSDEEVADAEREDRAAQRDRARVAKRNKPRTDLERVARGKLTGDL